METKFTKGEWQSVKGSSSGRLVVAISAPKTKRNIAHVGGPDREANAHLIASSPTMFDVLEEAPVLSKYHGTIGFESDRFISDYQDWMDRRRAALRLARGEG